MKVGLAVGTVTLAACGHALAVDPIPAFSGADGAAAYVTGGRGGIVYHVTKLDTSFNDNAPGTLRYGLDNNNFPNVPRTIVFDVGGTIHLGRTVSGWDGNGNGWDTQSRLNIPSNVTIAGQTAPGGITIMGGVLKVNGNNAIIRNVTIAPGYGNRNFNQPDSPPTPGTWPDRYVYDAIDITGTNIMIDHVTAVYATDETISANELANNVTIQYSIIGQGQNYPQADAEASGVRYTGHALGSLLQGGSNAKFSVHHNLYAHLKGRLPRVGSEVGTGAYNDFRNNVFYNWFDTAGGGASGQPSFNNFVGNFYLAGPGGDDQDPSNTTVGKIVQKSGGTGIFNGASSSATRVYHAGNYADLNKDGDPNDAVLLTTSSFSNSSIQASAYTQAPYYGVTDTAVEAFDRVLNYAGANWWERDGVIDTVNERLVHEVLTGTGKIMAWADDPFNNDPQEGTEWRALRNAPTVTRPANWDTDQDGMPDTWEIKHGLNPAVANNNADFDADGYTDLEEYLNEIAAWPAPGPITFTGSASTRYAEIHNWHLLPVPTATDIWQPSRYDTARINTGTVVVDAVGQHAGTLQIAAASGGSATMNVTGGWIEIADQLQVGAGGMATVNQTGGLVVADTVVLGAVAGSGGTYYLSGGVLDTRVLTRGPGAVAFEFTGGELHADIITFSFTNNGGTLAPGHSIGHTEVLGDLNLVAGTLQIEVNDFTSDTVGVIGVARLGGTLEVIGLDGFVPSVGDFWTILMADQLIVGTFTDITEGYAVRFLPNTVVLEYVGVPEPGVLAPGLLAGMGLMARVRRGCRPEQNAA